MSVRHFLALLALTLFAGHPAVAEEISYRLGAQDKLRIYVNEWPPLTGEFTIGADGKLALPLIGEIPAAGLLTAELASRISERLKLKAQLVETPEAAVSIAQYRPFYILGGVERPGEYTFRPGMVVLNAVTIAGGVYRPPRTSDWGFERDAITGRGDLRTASAKRDELAAREWRLKAETEGLEELPELASTTIPARLLDEERNVFRARLERYRNQLAAFDQTVTLHEREIVSIQAQSAAAEKQKDSVARELEDTRGLIARGLAPAPRILPLERTVAQIEREQRELDTAVLRAKQQINLTKALEDSLRDERKSSGLAEIQSIHAQLKELQEKSETASHLVSGSMALSSAPATDNDAESAPALTFMILRPTDGRIQDLPAVETTPLQPGDILKVFRAQDSSPKVGQPAATRRSLLSGDPQAVGSLR